MHQDSHGGIATMAGADAATLLGRVAGRLAIGDDDALAACLVLVVDRLALRSAVLRAVDGAVLAVAGEVVHAVPLSRVGPPAAAVVELPVQAAGAPLATLTLAGGRPSQLPLLRAVAAVLALDLRRAPAPSLPLALLDAADAAVDLAADVLHDGPVQELVAARYTVDAVMRGGGDVTLVRDAVQSALVSLRRAVWLLRPRGAGPDGLADALPQLSARLKEAGRPGLLLDVDAVACARLSPQAASACFHLVQEVAGQAADRPTAVRVRAAADRVRLELDADDVPADRATWSVRAQALGADLLHPDVATGRLVFSVPVPARPTPAPTT